MKSKVSIPVVLTFVLGLWLNASPFARAQKSEVAVDYSLLIYNPAKNFAGTRNLNGGGGSYTYNFMPFLGIRADFQGYTSTTLTFKVIANPPTIPLTRAFNTQANLFTYLFGPQVTIPAKRVRVFGDILFGSAHTNAYANLFQGAGITSLQANNNGFAMSFGGGLDLPVTNHFALRPGEFDYLLTRYEWQSIGINNQSNFRYNAGAVFRF